MVARKLVPYSLYLPQEYHDRLREYARQRKASEVIRDAIAMMLDGGDEYTSGYNQGLRDAAKIVFDCEEATYVSVKGRDVGELLSERIEGLKK
jgi:hypothetical protein